MIAVLFSVLLFASDTSAATAQPELAQPAAETPKDEKKICKRDLDSTSRMGSKRTCLTAAEWKARDAGFKRPEYSIKH